MRDEGKRDDGGPAFPRPTSTDEHKDQCSIWYAREGMSLRDWFAGQALGVIDPSNVREYELKAMFGEHRTGITREEIAAHLAYRVADAMLEARKP